MGFFSKTKKADALVIGLGNPGEQYANTRHNAGFMAVDALAERFGATNWRLRFDALVAEKTVPGVGLVVLVKPQTMMNLSGRAVKGAARHYGLEAGDIWVLHDDIDLEPGILRIKVGGGHGGHNGIRSIIDSLSPDFTRVKIGVGRPPGRMDSADYVLQKMRGQSLEELAVDANRAAEAVEYALKNGASAAQTKFN